MTAKQQDFSSVTLSTSVCAPFLGAQSIVNRWRSVRGDHRLGIATDPRLPVPIQREILGKVVPEVGGDGIDLVHPMLDHRGGSAPSPLSSDRDERLAAAAALKATITLAGEFHVDRLTIYPWPLRLHRRVEELQHALALGQSLQLDILAQERQTLAPTGLDHLRALLEPALIHASDVGTQLYFATPTIWPHQMPDHHEVERLFAEFSGAPLCTGLLTDWQACARHVGWPSPQEITIRRSHANPGLILAEPESWISEIGVALGVLDIPDPTPKGPALKRNLIRVADASGLALRLPLGLGELGCTQEGWRGLQESLAGMEHILLAFDEETQETDLKTSLALLANLIEFDTDAFADPS